MNILAIESSCDETAVAIVRDGREVLTDCISSQVELHKLYGGVVPEIASRKHIEAIYGLADQALEQAQLTRGDIDAMAVTYAPGLIGAVLVGVNFAKLAALGLGVPLVPVHHIRGHIAANYLAYPELEQKFAMAIGKTFRFDRIAGHSWKQFAADMNVRPERLYSLMEKLHESVMPAVEPLVAQHEGQYGASPVYERLVRIVRDGLNRLMRVTEESSKP